MRWVHLQELVISVTESLEEGMSALQAEVRFPPRWLFVS
jgi:hypothetical protein